MSDHRRRDEVARLRERQRLQEIAQAAGQGRMAVVDGLGRQVQVGDFVSIQALPQATIFRVAKLEPILVDPQYAGMIHATFVAEMTMTLPSGHPQGLLIVAPAEALPQQAGQTGAEASVPPEDPGLPESPAGPRLITLAD